jgi:hypothetical protein
MAHGRRQSAPGTIEFKRGAPKWGQTDQDRMRAKIADTGVLNKLAEVLDGKREMSQAQVSIALKFLDKLVPQLQASQIEVTETQPFALLPSILEDVQAWQATFKPALPKPDTEH